jgi:hypothetical protein
MNEWGRRESCQAREEVEAVPRELAFPGHINRKADLFTIIIIAMNKKNGTGIHHNATGTPSRKSGNSTLLDSCSDRLQQACVSPVRRV